MFVRVLLMVLVGFMPGLLPSVSACGLEPNIGGGLTVSYPGSLEVAVAVAEARRKGLLPQATSTVASNQSRLHQMLADLRRLQSRLDHGGSVDTSASFSIVLVGPGLWSRYYLTPRGAIAQYHTPGPGDDEVVVMMHPLVLQALLRGSLTTSVATESGLLVFSGKGSSPVQNAFESSFEGSASSLAFVNPVGGD